MLHYPAGYYCPNLDCRYNTAFDEPEKSQIEAFEIVRRQRDGDAYAGMPDDERLRLLECCNRICLAADPDFFDLKRAIAQKEGERGLRKTV